MYNYLATIDDECILWIVLACVVDMNRIGCEKISRLSNWKIATSKNSNLLNVQKKHSKRHSALIPHTTDNSN